MNEAQLVLQAYSITEKVKRDQGIELQKFLLARDFFLEFLGVRVPAEPHEIELNNYTYKKSHSLPLIYLLAPLIGADNINKMIKSYGDSLDKDKDDAFRTKKEAENFDSVYQLIESGYDADDIAKEMTGKSVDELLEDSLNKQKNEELKQVAVSADEFSNIKDRIMNENPVKKSKKKHQFTIKLED